MPLIISLTIYSDNCTPNRNWIQMVGSGNTSSRSRLPDSIALKLLRMWSFRIQCVLPRQVSVLENEMNRLFCLSKSGRWLLLYTNAANDYWIFAIWTENSSNGEIGRFKHLGIKKSISKLRRDVSSKLKWQQFSYLNYNILIIRILLPLKLNSVFRINWFSHHFRTYANLSHILKQFSLLIWRKPDFSRF